MDVQFSLVVKRCRLSGKAGTSGILTDGAVISAVSFSSRVRIPGVWPHCYDAGMVPGIENRLPVQCQRYFLGAFLIRRQENPGLETADRGVQDQPVPIDSRLKLEVKHGRYECLLQLWCQSRHSRSRVTFSAS